MGRRAERTVHSPAARSAHASAAERSAPSIVATAPRKSRSSSAAPPGATGITRQSPWGRSRTAERIAPPGIRQATTARPAGSIAAAGRRGAVGNVPDSTTRTQGALAGSRTRASTWLRPWMVVANAATASPPVPAAAEGSPGSAPRGVIVSGGCHVRPAAAAVPAAATATSTPASATRPQVMAGTMSGRGDGGILAG